MCRCFPFFVWFGLKKKNFFFLHVGNSALERRLKNCLKFLPPKQQQQKPSQNPHSNSPILRGVDGDLLRPPGPLLIQTQMHGPGVFHMVHVWGRGHWGRLLLSWPSLSSVRSPHVALTESKGGILAVPTVDPQLLKLFFSFRVSTKFIILQ